MTQNILITFTVRLVGGRGRDGGLRVRIVEPEPRGFVAEQW